jgi:Transglycosylase-like domain
MRRSVLAACLVLLLATTHPPRRPPPGTPPVQPPAPATTSPTTTMTGTTATTASTTTMTAPRPERPRASRSWPRPRTPVPGPSPTPGPARPWEEVREHIAACESSGNPTARNPRSSASGLYQAIHGTWHGYGGYPSAADAPVEVQERHAAELYARRGLQPWRASAGCWRKRLGR